MRSVTLGLIQSSVSQNPNENLEQTIAQIRSAAAQGAQIICLQELFKTLYFCQTFSQDFFSLAEPVPGPTIQALSAVCREQNITLIVPLFEKAALGVYYNSAVVLGPQGDILGHYRKIHIPDDPGYHEKYYFAPGDKGVCVVQTPHARIGVLICWDQWFPEIARMTALEGAEILFYPTAIGWVPEPGMSSPGDELEAWKTIQKSHAIANGCYVASVNRTRQEGNIRFWGNSFVCDPFGTVRAQAGEKPEIILVECDLSKIEKIRNEWPFWRDRRVDCYGGIIQRHGNTEKME